MTRGCATCSAATFGPLVQDGVSTATIARRARDVADQAERVGVDASAVHACADTLMLLAAELAAKR